MSAQMQSVPLKVRAEDNDKPLRRCVESALANYFAHLNGHAPGDLHQMVMAEVEGPLLAAVMDYTEGNQTKAAQVLGINRGTLRKKLREFGLAD